MVKQGRFHWLSILSMVTVLWTVTSSEAATSGPVLYEGALPTSQLTWQTDDDGLHYPLLPTTDELAETGKPVLARKSILVLVPWDLSLDGVEIVPLATHHESLPGSLRNGGLLFSDSGDGINVDSLPVDKNTYPATWGEYGGQHVFRGFRLVAVSLYPLRVTRDPAGQWSSVEILDRFAVRAVSLGSTPAPDVTHRQRHVPGQRQRTEAHLGAVIANPEALSSYDRPDGDVVVESTGFAPTRTPSLNGSSVLYLIITNELLAPAFQQLADHKTAQGLPAVVATTEWIESNFRNGADLQETVRLFIRDAYQKWGTEYVLLGGDTDILPARFATNTYYPSVGYTEIPSDLYFACLDGNWNADGDYVFGEHYSSPTYPGDDVDMADEVFVGRAPVSSPAAASIFVDKVITYTETAASSAWVNRALFSAEVLFWHENGDIQLDGAEFSEGIVSDYLEPCTDMSTVRMYENYQDYPGSTLLSRAALIDTLNSGHFGLFDQVGHGFFFNMSVADANFTVSDADALVNGDHLFVLWALNCASAAFDHSCLMERFLQNPNGGSIISIGSTRGAFPQTANSYQNEFYYHLFCQETFRTAELVSLSRLPYLDQTPYNTVHRWTYYNYNMLGDPALAIWTGEPVPVQVSAPASIGAGQQIVNVNVQVQGTPEEGALVCLMKEGEDYVTHETNQFGNVSVPFTATSDGNITLTVTGPNLEFHQTSIAVDPGATFITMSEAFILDDGSEGSNGNDNAQPEAGEVLAMYMLCEDTGGGGASGCNANLISRDLGITVIDASATIGTVPPGGTKLAEDPFRFSLTSGLPDGFEATFDVIITDNGGNTYETMWSLTVLAPEPEPVELVWSDAAYGDGDGVFESGEEVTVAITLKNFGAGLSDQVTGILRTSDPEVTLYDSTVSYNDLALLQHSSGSGQLLLSDDNVATPGWCWVLFQDNYGRSFRHDFRIQPPVVPVGLEADTAYGPDIIALRWLPVQEDEQRGYHVYRSEQPAGPFTRVNKDLVDGISYFWDGSLSLLTRYYYYVTSVDSALVESTPSAVISQSTAPPELTNYPLPFNMETSGHCAVGDITGDGRLEIILGSDEIYVWTEDGDELLDGDNNAQTHGPITNFASQFQPAGIALAPLDNTPGMEIIASERDVPRIHVIRHDGSPMTGWPQDLMDNPGSGWNWATPAVGDVDGDGQLEIVVNTQDGRTWVWHANGSELMDGDNDPMTKGIFLERPGAQWEYGNSSPALFDLDEDGAKDIIFGTKYGPDQDNYILAYRYDGTLVPGFPYNTGPGNIINSPTVADLNEDRTWEIIIVSQGDKLFVVQQDGTDYPGFPIPFLSDTGFAPSPALGDFDQDEQLEIVAVSTDSQELAYLYVIDTDLENGTSGDIMAGWPQELPGNSEASPVVGDLDGDGVPDIVHGIGGGSEDSPNRLYAFKATGEPVDGFPITLGGPLRASPFICDLDQDHDVDLVYGGWDMQIHVWDLPGAYDPVRVPWASFRGHVYRDGVHRSPTVVDVPDPISPELMQLTPPHPNPFNPSTSVQLYVPGAAGPQSDLDVSVYDLQGRRVRVLHTGPLATGWHTLMWDGRDDSGRAQASGVYVLRARGGDTTIARKLALVK